MDFRVFHIWGGGNCGLPRVDSASCPMNVHRQNDRQGREAVSHVSHNCEKGGSAALVVEPISQKHLCWGEADGLSPTFQVRNRILKPRSLVSLSLKTRLFFVPDGGLSGHFHRVCIQPKPASTFP